MAQIVKEQVFPLLLAACPSFASEYAQSVNDNGPELLYVHAGNFAQHLLQLHQAAKRQEFPAVVALLERLHSEGEQYVRELATIGFLEGIQNVWSHSSSKPQEFYSFLGPVSAASWQALNDFWQGEIPHVPDTNRA